MALTLGLSALDSGYLHCETIPPDVLGALVVHRADLQTVLSAAPRATIMKILASLSGMPSQAVVNEDELAALLRQDVEDLSDLSAWALESAARAFRRGEIGDGKWRPTAGQLRKEARQREIDPRADLYKLGRLLDHKDIRAPRPVYIPQNEVQELHARIGKLATRGSTDE